MKTGITALIVVTAAIIATVACNRKSTSDGPTPPEEYDTVLVSTGRRAAESALQFPPGSSERENAILAIRAAEYRLRQAGMTRSADSYIAGAGQVLDTLGRTTKRTDPD